MSWVEKIKNGLIITCGDGKSYEPLYMITSKSKEYNISEFDFVNIPGTLVKRYKPRGRRYNFKLVFQGEDHLDQYEAFEKSADDERPWTVSHPIYGQLLMQPTGLQFDPSGLSMTEISGELIETISDDYPRISKDPTDNAKKLFSDYKNASSESYVNSVSPTTETIQQATNDVNKSYSLGSASVESGDLANEYFQLFNNALNAINVAASDASTAATLAIDILTYPAKFKTQVKSRIDLLIQQYNSLKVGFDNLFNPNQKSTFETNGGAIISAMADAAINPIAGDYNNSKSVLLIIDDLVDTYNQYINDLNELQSDNGANLESYLPSPIGIAGITDLINYVVSKLMDIAMEAKQERTFILDEDSNAIILAHRFYGLSEETNNVERLLNENNLSIASILQLNKGDSILYYV